MRKLIPAVAIIAFACVAVSCGGGGDGGKVVVGVEGGVVTSDDGRLTLDIPTGALDEEVEITITAVSVGELPEKLREASGPGPAYRLEPDGLVFNEPVPVTLELNRSELDDVPEDSVVAHLLLTLDADGEIEFLDELVTEATLGEETIAVRGELSHFSWLTESDGPLIVNLERVELTQEAGFIANVSFEAYETGGIFGYGRLIEVFSDTFGLRAAEAVGEIEANPEGGPPGDIFEGGEGTSAEALYDCVELGLGRLRHPYAMAHP